MSGEDKKVVLIVDDSASIRSAVKVILEKEGYIVREAGTELGMMNSIDEYGRRADIVLMDLTLNDAYGFDLIAKLKEYDRYRDIPVVVLTEHSDKENVIMAKMVGVNGYIVKPLNPALLIERIKGVVGN